MEDSSKKAPVLIVDTFPFSIIYPSIKQIVGKPMTYHEFIKNNKKNPQGSSLIKSISEEDDDSEN